jgi:hypothetical protein
MPGSTLTIKERTGRQRELRLTARALPYRPYTLKATQRVETTWYPGSPEGSATVLGGSHEPTTIHGFWKEKYIGDTTIVSAALDGTQIVTVRELVDAMDSLRGEGQEVEVTWDEEVRRGLITEFERRWHNPQDVEWEVTFQWLSVGSAESQPELDGETSVGDTASVMGAQNDALQASATPPFPVSSDFSDTLTTQLLDIADSVASARGVVANLLIAAISPFDAARRMVAITGAVAEQAQTLIDTLAGAPSRLLNAGVEVEQMTLGQIIAAEGYVREMQRNARALKRTAVLRQQVLARAIQNDLLAVHRARDGQDLRDVSRIYYGTAFEWRRLMNFNELESAELVAGQVVLVPRVTTGGVG